MKTLFNWVLVLLPLSYIYNGYVEFHFQWRILVQVTKMIHFVVPFRTFFANYNCLILLAVMNLYPLMKTPFNISYTRLENSLTFGPKYGKEKDSVELSCRIASRSSFEEFTSNFTK